MKTSDGRLAGTWSTGRMQTLGLGGDGESMSCRTAWAEMHTFQSLEDQRFSLSGRDGRHYGVELWQRVAR